jgi:hypothetical protein
MMQIFFNSICKDIVSILYGFVKILCLKFKYKEGDFAYRQVPKNATISFVIGNGPSLENDIKILKKIPENSYVYAVNFFGISDEFFLVKPNRYVIVDRVFWSNSSREHFQELNNKLLSNLGKVNWPMLLLVAPEGVDFYKKNIENVNINIKSLKLPTSPLLSPIIYKFFVKKRIFSPYIVNVLVTALWLAVIETKGVIFLIGADSDGFKNIKVNQITNLVLTGNSYSSKITKESSDKINQPERTASQKSVAQRIYQHYLSFLSFEAVGEFAREEKCQIINKSSNSYIDCFERQEEKLK